MLRQAKVLVLNYPNNPTGASATRSSSPKRWPLRRSTAWSSSTMPPTRRWYSRAGLLSFLATPGARDTGLELHSASKSFNMTGWRCGFVAGNPLLVKAYGDVKDNTDSGQFLAIQHAAARGFDHPEITAQIAAKYSRRMEALARVLGDAGFGARKPKGSFFLTSRLPKRP